MGKPAGQKGGMEQSKIAGERAAVEFGQKQADRKQMQPLISALFGLGIDPQTFMQSALGQSLLGVQRQGISNEFDAARMNFSEFSGERGLTGSGVSAGPMANLFSQEAMAQADAINRTSMTGLDLGMQGANLLAGQQGMLNPLGFGSSAIGGFNSIQQGQWGKNILGAAGAAIGGAAAGGAFSK